MSRSVLLTALVLFVLGLVPLVAKVAVYDVPIAPTDTRGLWQVELRITVRGDGRRGRPYQRRSGLTSLNPKQSAYPIRRNIH